MVLVTKKALRSRYATSKKLDKAAYRDLSNETIINHFYEKLFKIKDMLNTAEAKAIAKERHELMVAYVTAFKADW